LRNVVAEAVLADELGLDFIGVGEHHRADFAVSAPEVVLAAIAGQTSRIRLGSAVTVLSSDDPVRVFERFATLVLQRQLLKKSGRLPGEARHDRSHCH
jgi:alkanesulfonate monooxygenase SsuD/methylene tetrahydromethanopterin reductase-like flavin-dependent oxidoreductase (luciferase family)